MKCSEVAFQFCSPLCLAAILWLKYQFNKKFFNVELLSIKLCFTYPGFWSNESSEGNSNWKIEGPRKFSSTSETSVNILRHCFQSCIYINYTKDLKIKDYDNNVLDLLMLITSTENLLISELSLFNNYLEID